MMCKLNEILEISDEISDSAAHSKRSGKRTVLTSLMLIIRKKDFRIENSNTGKHFNKLITIKK